MAPSLSISHRQFFQTIHFPHSGTKRRFFPCRRTRRRAFPRSVSKSTFFVRAGAALGDVGICPVGKTWFAIVTLRSLVIGGTASPPRHRFCMRRGEVPTRDPVQALLGGAVGNAFASPVCPSNNPERAPMPSRHRHISRRRDAPSRNPGLPTNERTPRREVGQPPNLMLSRSSCETGRGGASGGPNRAKYSRAKSARHACSFCGAIGSTPLSQLEPVTGF